MTKADARRQAALTGLYYYGEAHYRHELARPEALPDGLKVVEPEAAMSALEQDRDPGHELAIRLALAELASAPEAFPDTFKAYVRRLAAVVRAPADDIINLPVKFLGGAPAARTQRFLEAYELAGGGGCQVRKLQLQASYQDHISDVLVSIEVNRPVGDFTNGLDPRNWSETMPSVWEQSFQFDLASLPMDRSQTPPPMARTTAPAGIWLFEKADWQLSFLTLAWWRTALRIDLDPSPPAIGFKYSLYECLENDFGGVKSAGGIDVDHGLGSCEVVTTTPTTWSKLSAQKVVRFTQPDLAINDVSFVSLIIWFSTLILTAACAPSA